MRVLLTVFVALLCGGCPPPPVARPYPPPRPEELLAHLQRSGAGLRALRAQAKAEYREGAGRLRVSAAVLAARPDRLRVAIESGLVGAIATLATDGNDLQLLDVREDRFYAGPAAPCALARLLRAELRPAEVVALLFGGALLPNPAQARVSWDGRDGGREVLTLTAPDGAATELRLDAGGRTWDLRELLQRDAGGRERLRIRSEGFEPHPLPSGALVRLPQATLIEDPVRKTSLRLRFRERELNPDLPEDAFRLAPPEGVPRLPAACGP